MQRQTFPVLPLRNTVIFPGLVVPIGVGRTASMRAVEAASESDGRVFAVSQRENVEDPAFEQLHGMGTIARIAKIARTISGHQVVLEGEQRAATLQYRETDDYVSAVVMPVEQMQALDPEDPAFAALYKELRERAVELGQLRGVPDNILHELVENVSDPGDFTDRVAGYVDVPVADKQSLLEMLGVEERMRRLLIYVQKRIDLLETQKQIKTQVQEELGERQREMYLREQLRAIQKELGEDDADKEIEELRDKLEALELPKPVKEEVDRELARLERSGRESMEAQIIRTYLEWIVELPWNTRSDDQLDLKHAIEVLDEDHHGLKDVKDRILEFLAVRQMRAQNLPATDTGDEEPDAAKAKAMAKGPILLFTGPPGVGKTSIAKSIARALGREYVRVALGGARDEADIRGHRRTYVGAMPGRIITGMKQAKSKNPVFLLDEVDKLGASFHGDPASALLEVLDPAQNHTFTDHYLNVPFDLSEVLFIATANFTESIPAPLLDRMEVVEFSGYTELEKAAIARRYLLPRQLEEAGLQDKPFSLSDDGLQAIITRYTRESGVRQLEREVGKVIRKVARRLAAGDDVSEQVDAALVRELLGRPRVRPEKAASEDEVGVATGMYYTPAGGDIMFVEVAIRPLGSRRGDSEGVSGTSLILTGQLGDVMKESARAAATYVTHHAARLHVLPQYRDNVEAHIHVPAGAIPKDGPSAGVAMATALASAMSGIAVREDVAMTGEVTLRGRVLPIGGVKEKVLGAARAGITHVILPRENEPELEDLPEEVRDSMTFRAVSSLDEVLEVALVAPTAGTAEPHVTIN